MRTRAPQGTATHPEPRSTGAAILRTVLAIDDPPPGPRTAPGRPAGPPRGSVRRRVLVVFAAIAVVFAVLTARVADIQTRNRSRYASLGLDQRLRTPEVAAERGAVFDRSGHELALSVARETIYADPAMIRHPAEAAAALAPLVGVDELALRVRLSQPNSRFQYVARTVEPDVADAVRELAIPGIGSYTESKRYYPSGDLAAPVIGMVGVDGNGLTGLEHVLDGTLAGTPGKKRVERDPTGTVLPGTERVVTPARPGDDVVLTIDRSVQFEAEQALVEQVTAASAKGGMAIVMDVQTGDVLAMASVDGATDATPTRPSAASSRNRPVTDVFEPGSTNKVVTIASALEAGVVTPGTVIQTPGAIMVDGKRFEDTEVHGPQLTVAEVLAESSNVGTITIAGELGADRFDAALRNFGFGRETGLQFPGEASGIVMARRNYNGTSMASMPIGNGLAVTALQMLDVYVTIANDGVARQPRLIAATIGADGSRVDAAPGYTRQVVSADTAVAMRRMLAGVVTAGTGVKAAVPGYSVGGKTGTARKPPYEHPPYRYVASFAGFAPVEHPRLAAIVVIDEPSGVYFGGQVAAPVFSRIMQHALATERVPGDTAVNAATTLTALP